MKNLLAVSLHPAIQRTQVYSQLRPGEVNRPSELYLDLSGKGGNAARTAALCGIPAVHLCFWHPSEEPFCRKLSDEAGVSLAGVGVNSFLRHCTTVVETIPTLATELAEAMEPIDDFPQAEFMAVFEQELEKAEFVVLAGSRAPGVPAQIVADLAEAAHRKKVRFLADLRGPELHAVLPFSPFAVKINKEEWHSSFPTETEFSGWEQFRKVTTSLGGRWIVTDGGKEVWYAVDGQVGQIPVPPVSSLNPIGCGDFFNGVLLSQLMGGKPWTEALETAIKAASFSAETVRAAWMDREKLKMILEGD